MTATATDRLAGLTTSVAIKPACVAVATFSLPLSGLFTLNGITLQEGDRVLVTAQTNPVDNGIYNASTSDWPRSLDFDGPRDVVSGTLVLVHNNFAEGLLYEVITLGDIVVGTTSITFRAQDDPSIAYAQTQAEILASVIPSNHAYPPLFVDRYGLNAVPGTTAMDSAFQKATNIMRLSGGEVTWGPGPYRLKAPLDCTYNTSANQFGLKFRGLGNDAIDTPSLIAEHTGYVFDFTGCDSYTVQDCTIGTDSVTYPKVCYFQARANVAGSNSQLPRILNTKVSGKFSKVVQYNYGAEDGVYVGNYWANHASDAGAKVIYITANNALALTSTFATIRSGSQSCIDHEYFGGQYWMDSSDAGADVVALDHCAHVKFYGPWMDCGTGAGVGGRSLVYVNMDHGSSDYVVLNGITTENLFTQNGYGIFFSNAAGTPTGWRIDGCYLPAATNAIFASALVVLDNFHVKKVSQDVANNGISATLLQNSVVDIGPIALTLGTSKNNTLIGFSENWTITTRINDTWIDQGTTNKSWTAGTGGLSITGGLTINRGRCEFNGRRVKVTLVLQAATSIACSAGNSITSLPAVAADYSSDVQVTNLTSAAVLGGGYVSGTNIFLSGISSTSAPICITAEYFAA